MNEQLIEFETAKLAKEKGFNIPCDGRWWIEPASSWKFSKQGAVKCNNSSDDSIARPTQSLLQKWLREVHNIDVYVQPVRFTGYIEIGYYTYSVMGEIPVKNYRYNSWEEALEVGLLEGLRLIEL